MIALSFIINRSHREQRWFPTGSECMCLSLRKSHLRVSSVTMKSHFKWIPQVPYVMPLLIGETAELFQTVLENNKWAE